MAFNKAKALLEAQKYVSEGKTSQAIKTYLRIVEKDPTDIILLNTVGDLYIRDKKFSDGMKQFHRLAEAYVKDGIVVKAIAMYRKISKLEPESVDPTLKLAELYVTQGLNREAREQYTAALALVQRKKDNKRALEVVRKLAQIDPSNPQGKLQLAEFAERAGEKKEAAGAYLEAATIADRMDDGAMGEKALNKALTLDPENPAIPLLRARQSRRKNDFVEVERILTSAPGLAEDQGARRLLFDSYLALNKKEDAERLLSKVYQQNPADFSPVAGYVKQCLARLDIDSAFNSVNEVAEGLISQKNTDALMETLRSIWSAAPEHAGLMELIYDVAEKTADEATIPEVLEALGSVYVKQGELEKAEAVYQKLVGREPDNADYKELLKQVLQKQGKEYIPANAEQLSAANAALEAPTGEVSAETPEEAKGVKEAIDNSDLFVRYNLTEKAVAELEKVLEVYPNQITIHRTLFEICRKNLPLRSQRAAETLAKIYAQQGDEASAHYYGRVAGLSMNEIGALEPPPPAAQIEVTAAATPAEAARPESAPASALSAQAPQEFDLSQEFGFSEPPTAPDETPLDFNARQAKEEVATPEPAPGEAATTTPETIAAPAFNYDESAEEIRFYLSEGLTREAEKTVENLEVAYPGDPHVATLRKLLESSPLAEPALAPAEGPSAEEGIVVPTAAEGEEKQPESTSAEPPQAVEAPKEWELPASFAAPAATETAPADAPVANQDLLGGLAEGLADGLDQIGAAAASQAASGKPESGKGAAVGPMSELSGLLEELGEPAEAAAGDDPETHYNLGVAFREMGLLDEAIGEFQKVAKGTGKGGFPPNFLQACTLLAACFGEKGMPAIAAKWYLRALETPGLDEEATLALQYDLGSAYEQAGDAKTALEKFTEVYSQNIDYRDVAEKIRLLQLKAS